MNPQLRLLIVEDVEDDALLMVEALRRAGYEVSFMIVDEEEAFLHELLSERWELILCDYNLPKFSAINALRVMRELDSDLPFLVVSGTIGEMKAVELMRAGACEFIRKDCLSLLAPACERELRNAEIRRQNRRALDDLRESEEKFRILTTFSPIGVLLSNAQGNAVYINDKCAELIGMPVEEALNSGWISAIHPDDRGWATTAWFKAVRNGEDFHQEFRWLHADGEVVWTQEDSIPVRGREGEVDAYICTFIDITERKQAEGNLIKEKVFSEKIIDTSDAIIVGLDKNHRIKLFNRGAEKITGYKSTDVFGKDWFKIFFPAEIINEMEKVWKDSWSQESHSYTNPILIKSGAERVISWQTTGIYEGEEKNHLLISIGLDITERVQAKTDLEKSHQQLRDLTRYLQNAREKERSLIAREIHDEFGQALTALKMDLTWMSKRLPPDTPILAGKITTMSKMVDDTIRMVQRIATALRPGLLDDLGLVAAMEWQMQEFAERSGITFELHTPEEETTLNRDFALTLYRIFQEALTNVARHANAASVRVELEVDPGEVLLIIGDDGDGITESELAATTSLGLIGMRERARSIGGDVIIQGVPGQGTTVTVCVPRPAEDGSSK